MSITRNNIIVGDVDWVKLNGTDIGATFDGVAVTKSREDFEHEVDQYLDAVDRTPTNYAQEVEFQMSEATLANLYRVWNEKTLPTTNVLNLGMNTTINEFTLEFRGRAPGGLTTRTYYFYRAVPVDESSHATKKDDRILYPVKFRIMPDITKAEGSEYGFYLDA